MSFSSKIENALVNFDNEIIPTEPPQELPLLNEYRNKYKKKEYFKDLDVLFIQHHLGPFLPRIAAMSNDGLEKRRTWFIDIPYSTNNETKSTMMSTGFNIDQMTNPFNDPLDDYDKNQNDRIKFLLLRLISREDPGEILVIDDGAYFLRFLYSADLHDPKIAQMFTGTRIVEQTTRGYRFIENQAKKIIKKYNLSVVSIARCNTKLNFESPFIGAAVSRAVTNKIGIDKLTKMKSIAVIGFGSVGRATVKRLLTKSPEAHIDIVDIDEEKRNEAWELSKERCSPIKVLNSAKQYEMVVGCTGYNSFELGDRMLLADGAYLISGSSAALEFNRAGFVELADKYPDDEIEILNRNETIKKGIHAEIIFSQEGGKKFSFLNSGFPINFDGMMECLPTRIIQSTHTLLYSAATQTIENYQPGEFQRIDPEKDHWIFEHSENYL